MLNVSPRRLDSPVFIPRPSGLFLSVDELLPFN
jgi:hypothetical protein